MSKFKTPVFVLSLSLFVLFLISCGQSGASSSSSASKGEAAAVVNGTKITIADVDRVTAEQAQGQQNQLSPLELAAARLRVLEGLITNEILYQKAKADKLLPDEQAVTTFIQQSKADSGMTEEAFQKRLKETNQTEAEFREDIRKQMAIKKLDDNIANQIKVSDPEVEQAFKASPPVAPAGIALSDIVVDPQQNFQGSDPNDAKGEVEAKNKIDGIYAQLRGGSDFATIARVRSEDQSANRAGDLGFIPMEQIQQSFGPFAAKIMGLKEGEYTEPLKESNGRWHIFKMTGKRAQEQKLSLDDPEVRKQIADQIRQQRASLLSSALMAQARNEAKVENYLISDLIKNPNSLGVLRPVNPQASPKGSASPQTSPAAQASPGASPAAAAKASPSGAAKPAASPSATAKK
ncbi:MAG: SurA N-terminal domain-containing protein [Blastocatellia bacterium]